MVYTEALGPAAYIGRARVVPLRNMGAAISPFNAFLILQGHRDAAVAHGPHLRECTGGRQLPQAHAKVAWVSYAGLSDHPITRWCKNTWAGRASGILSFGVKGGLDGGGAFPGCAASCSPGWSTSAMPSRWPAIRPRPRTASSAPEEMAKAGVSEDMVRLSVGIEHIDDLLADLDAGAGRDLTFVGPIRPAGGRPVGSAVGRAKLLRSIQVRPRKMEKTEKLHSRPSLPNNRADDEEIARYAKLLDSVNIGLQVFTADALPCFRNKQADRLLGNRMHNWLDERGMPVAPDEHPLRFALRTGRPVLDRIMALTGDTDDRANVYGEAGDDEESIWLNVNALPVLGSDGSVRRILLTLTDISEMRFLQTAVEQLSIRDPLTGVFNQPHVLHLLENEIHRARRYGTPFTLAQIDIDHFRPFCTEHGQAVGNKVLIRMGQLLNDSMREIDIAGRIGIDDYLLILPNIGLKDAMVGLERLRGLIETQTFTDKFVRITISGGIVEYTGENAEAMIERCQSLVAVARQAAAIASVWTPTFSSGGNSPIGRFTRCAAAPGSRASAFR